ncbi:MAG: MFS transporter [Clostridia bacterium]|nr:MFS transporter [Clostridia bacterium]
MKLTYKATRNACYFGCIVQAVIVNLAPLMFTIMQDRFDISLEMLGRLVLVNFVTQMTVDVLTVKYIDKIGYRAGIVTAQVLAAVGFVMLALLPQVMPSPYVGLVIATIVYAAGGGLLEVLISPILNALPQNGSAAAMSLLHSFFCWGQVGTVIITTALLRLVGPDLWYLLPLIWAVLPAITFFLMLKVPMPETESEESRTPIRSLVKVPLFVMFLFLMLSAGASECAMSQWSSLFAEQALGLDKVMGDFLGPCAFAILMGIARTIYGIFGDRINLRLALFGSGVLCVGCYLLAALSSNSYLSVIGCAFCGFSIAIMWPGMLSESASRFPHGGGAMFGLLATFGDIGCAFGPWLCGLVADTTGLGIRTGLFVSLIFPMMMVIGTLIMGGKKETE